MENHKLAASVVEARVEARARVTDDKFGGALSALQAVMERRADGLTIGEASQIGGRAMTCLRLLDGSLVVETATLTLVASKDGEE